ncbi:zinc dependent phospholipase C family protein [Paenibacillus albidus]|uniref:zinc dependent phospholipase C family protein n=1 Tax=Paenibacillus albidus TaxID=2041023 RepID=UPI001BE7975D|nr:zinc dependent phospholipase C family protein [Paenibacillus albidus]MBT2293332.1 zinc dependent phospholipase C family protein [Paenibacillus albidus]
MPNIWMHLEFGQKLAEEFREQLPWLTGMERRRSLYLLGCQGPDFLLYHSFLPWRHNLRAVHLGDLMHSRHCGPVLLSFWQRTLTLPASERNDAQLYFLGFITHHLLDRNLHPYINWKAGYTGRNHQRFEIMLDTVFMNRLKGEDTWKKPAWKEINIGSGFPSSIQTILHETAGEWYPEVMAHFPCECWNEAYLDMVLAHKCLYDPKGWKKSLLWGGARRFFYQKLTPDDEQLDYLNERHAQWRHSAMYSEIATDSVWDLWEQALDEGRLVIGALADWLACTDTAEAACKLDVLVQVLDNRSYDTGKACNSNLVNRYAEPIWGVNTGS